jgi:uncharacterized protein (TIGR01777 family)
MKKIILAGGTGFLGKILAAFFRKNGYEVVILTRSPKSLFRDGIHEVLWDARSLGKWVSKLEGADTVINLAGRTVNCRYNGENRRLILDSRVESTRVIGVAIAQCKTPPKVWLNSSTATIYKHTYDAAWDESGIIGATAEAKDEFSVEVATAWEKALNDSHTPKTRKLALRSSMVLGAYENSVFPMLRRLTKLGLGGRMGDGKQFVSWIHEDDFCRAIERVLSHDTLTKVVNICAPNPLANSEMMRMFRQTFGMSIGLPAEKWMLEIGAFLLRTETELIIKSRRVIPRKLIESGFQFEFPYLHLALKHLQHR